MRRAQWYAAAGIAAVAAVGLTVGAGPGTSASASGRHALYASHSATIAQPTIAVSAAPVQPAVLETASKAPSNPATLKKSCTLWFNHTAGKPKDKTPGHSLWVTKKPHRTVNYRYNWDSQYAVVATWKPVIWGFMNRSCLGSPAHPVGGDWSNICQRTSRSTRGGCAASRRSTSATTINGWSAGSTTGTTSSSTARAGR
jgi:hypothetical protein